MIINAGSNTAMQSMSPDHLRGRVISFFSTMFMGMFPLGSLTVGYFANCFGVSKAVEICSVICFFAGLFFYFKVPELENKSKDMLEIKRIEECKIQSAEL